MTSSEGVATEDADFTVSYDLVIKSRRLIRYQRTLISDTYLLDSMFSTHYREHWLVVAHSSPCTRRVMVLVPMKLAQFVLFLSQAAHSPSHKMSSSTQLTATCVHMLILFEMEARLRT